MADQATEEKSHVRGSKLSTYFGVSGALSFGLSALGTVLMAPLSVPGLILIGGGIALGATEGGRSFLKKAGDQLVDLVNDFTSHASEDIGRLGKWWHRVTASKAPDATAAAPAAPEKPSTFKPGASAPDFNNTAKPGAAAPEAKAPAPAPQPVEAPKQTL